jgi:hypothetical protein
MLTLLVRATDFGNTMISSLTSTGAILSYVNLPLYYSKRKNTQVAKFSLLQGMMHPKCK